MEIQESSLRCDVKSAEAKITAVCLLNLTAEMVRKSDGNRQAISWNRYLHTRLHCCPRPWLASLVNNRGKVSQFISCSMCATCGTPLRRRSKTGHVLCRSTPVFVVVCILCCSFIVLSRFLSSMSHGRSKFYSTIDVLILFSNFNFFFANCAGVQECHY